MSVFFDTKAHKKRQNGNYAILSAKFKSFINPSPLLLFRLELS